MNFLSRKTLESLRKEPGSDEGKVFNLVRGLHKEIDENGDASAVLQPLRERADRIIKDLEERNTSGLGAMDLLAALAADKDAALEAARESGLSSAGFAVFWSLKNDPALKAIGSAMELAREVDSQLARFPNARVNEGERRKLRAGLYRPLLALDMGERARVVDHALAILFDGNGDS